jgi:hypothetical protein
MQQRTSLKVFVSSMCALVVVLTGCTENSPSARQPDATNPTEVVIGSAPSSSSSTVPSRGVPDTTELIASVATGFGYSGQSGLSVFVFADGRVVSTDPETPWGFSEFTIAKGKVDELRKLAAERNLLEIRDTGDPGVTDQDFLIVNAPGTSGTIKQSVYAPNFDIDLTESHRAARADIDTFASALYALPNLPPAQLVQPLHAYNPTSLQVVAYPVMPNDPNDEPQPKPIPVEWGASKPISTLFASNYCIIMTGDDARWLRDEAAKQSPNAKTPQPVFVASLLPSPTLLRLEAQPAETVPYDCPNDPPKLAETSWPADERTVASSSDRWIGVSTLYQYAYDGKLGPYSSDARLSYLDLRYAHVVEGGQTFVDVLGIDMDSSTGPFEVAMRIDVTTGKVVQFTKEPPS